MSIRRSMTVLVVLAACQSGSSGSSSSGGSAGTAAKQAERGSAAPTAPSAPAVVSPLTGDALKAYTQDFERLCNAEQLSGALDQPEEARTLMVAQWLGKHLETSQVHDFLVHIQRLGAADKADVLDGEAKRLGLASCPLSAVWKAEAAKAAAPAPAR
jgi:hypothetical protein